MLRALPLRSGAPAAPRRLPGGRKACTADRKGRQAPPGEHAAARRGRPGCAAGRARAFSRLRAPSDISWRMRDESRSIGLVSTACHTCAAHARKGLTRARPP